MDLNLLSIDTRVSMTRSVPNDRGKSPMLSGYTILDFSQFVAGADVTLMLAELGANVIKVELAPGGDPTRTWPVIRNGRSGYFVQHNRGKQSLGINLKDPKGLNIVRDIIRRVDVVVENFTPGVFKTMGLGFDILQDLNPAIILCSVSTFGQTGPLAQDPGFDWSGAAYAGILDLMGEQDAPPVVPGAAMGDVSTAVHAFGATVCALLHRERTGRGQHVEASLLDSYFYYHEASLQQTSVSQGDVVQRRNGGHATYVAPAGIFTGSEGYILIFAQLDHLFQRLCDLMGTPELTANPKYNTNANRVTNLQELTEIIETWVQSYESDAQAIAAMKRARVPCAPVLTLADALEHPHIQQRGCAKQVVDPLLGPLTVPRFPLRFSDSPDEPDLVAPKLGQHNSDVLTGLLGLDEMEIRSLTQEGILIEGET